MRLEKKSRHVDVVAAKRVGMVERMRTPLVGPASWCTDSLAIKMIEIVELEETEVGQKGPPQQLTALYENELYRLLPLLLPLPRGE